MQSLSKKAQLPWDSLPPVSSLLPSRGRVSGCWADLCPFWAPLKSPLGTSVLPSYFWHHVLIPVLGPLEFLVVPECVLPPWVWAR